MARHGRSFPSQQPAARRGPSESGAIQIQIPLGALTLSGFGQTLNEQHILGAPAGISLTGYAPSQNLGLLQGSVADILFSGFSLTLVTDIGINAGALLLAGQAQSLAESLPVVQNSLFLTGLTPTLAQSIGVGVGLLLIESYSSTQSNEIDFGAVANLTLSGFAPTPAFDAQSISIDRGILSLAGFSQVLSDSIGIGKSDILATGFAPSLNTSTPISIGSLSIAGFVASLSQSASDISIDRGQLSISSYELSLNTGSQIIEIGLNELNLIGGSVSILQLLLIRQSDKREATTLTTARPDSTLTSSRSDNTLSSKRTST